MVYELIDTHCHLDFPEFDTDREEVILRANRQGVNYIINVGSSLSGSETGLRLSSKFDCIFPSIGIHPHEADSFNSRTLTSIKSLAKQGKVVAIGEIGLDYFKNYSKPQNQREMFSALLSLAKELSLPVIIHSRNAEADILEILNEYLPLKAVVHCFSGSADFLKRCFDLGLFVSFTCNITYKKSEDVRSLVSMAPLDKIFLETDAPFLSPEGLRGRRNEPMNVTYLADEIARIKGITPQEVAVTTSAGAKVFFNLK